ncbi:tyrosine-type recombinase/integrase [Natrinema salsiterrestre]|uniref:Tyrosine-type recombinase/integrase n=1 Tax=Natrinema salsiterrestre TaxID=2950540 RepID=A0A9Q4Q557_9EURY|nr:tyrosine-type recombinase/integrase [Natrinema salsiterrestre]MDF9747873.1 tyrosine-type recombinase/integrase [Natrinema salsiterrestre]
METTDSGPSPTGKLLENALDECIRSFDGNYDGDPSEIDGNYPRNLHRVTSKWITWCGKRETHTLEDVSVRTMQRYASHLEQRVRAKQADSSKGISASSAWTYYNYISAFLSWAVRWEYLAENPAEKERAKKEMPSRSTSNSGDQQFWQPEQRRAIMDYVDEQAREAIDADGMDAFEQVRNRALLAVLAYTGVRGAELLADSRDSRRNGIRWGDVDLEDGYLDVLGKSQDEEETALPEQAVEPLRRLETLLMPPNEDWPVFPSRHPPSLYDAIDNSEHDRPDGNPWEFVLERDIKPPSMSKSGARTLMKRLSKEADVPLEDSPKDYLTLHGARRGVGEKLYREHGAAASQRTLRHADPQTTSEMYSHIEASELAEDNTEVFENE